MKLFSVNWDAGQIAKLISLNQNMVNRYLLASGKRIVALYWWEVNFFDMPVKTKVMMSDL